MVVKPAKQFKIRYSKITNLTQMNIILLNNVALFKSIEIKII